MKVFLSWSGSGSRQLARILRRWLPLTVPNIKPWMSEEDIGAGAQWSAELAEQLNCTSQGVVCVSKENFKAPWLNFEAGSLAKAVQEKAYVRPLLLDISRADLTGPLTVFQSTIVTDRNDVFKMVRSLNDLSEDPHPEQRLTYVFDKFWEDLREQVAAIPPTVDDAALPRRTERELLEEVLTIVRGLQQPGGATAGGPQAARAAEFPRLSSIEKD
jgi:hypothetical protein